MFSLETARSLHDWVHYFVLVATIACIMAAFAILWPSNTKPGKSPAAKETKSKSEKPAAAKH